MVWHPRVPALDRAVRGGVEVNYRMAIVAAMIAAQRAFAVVSCCLALVVVSHPSIAYAQSRALTPEKIEEAIDLGASETPEPYVIPMAGPEAFEGSVFAAAFTPFLRVQFAANKAWTNTGRRLTPAEISPSVLAPVVHLAMWLGNEWEELPCLMKPPRFEVFEKGAGTPRRVWWDDTRASGILPLWAKHGLDTLAEYAALPLNHDDGRPLLWVSGRWMIVAYPLDFLRPDVNFFLTRGDGGIGSCISEGTIPSDELATWR